MEQISKAIEEAPHCVSLDALEESSVDLTKICWTQLLRETLEMVGPQRPFDPFLDDYSPERWFS